MIGSSLSHAKYAARHLFEAVTKVTEGYPRDFWHFWHLVTLGFWNIPKEACAYRGRGLEPSEGNRSA
jgi:hypothetical protein